MVEYTEERRERKIHKNHLLALKELTDGEIYWVQRRLNGKTGEGQNGMCHLNVAYWVNKIGGRRVDGWAYNERKMAVRNGIHLWFWHSVWETPEGKLVDVTMNDELEGRNKLTFIIDKERETDIEKGIGYNNVIIVENELIANKISSKSNFKVEKWVAYWTDESVENIEELNKMDGKYRWLDGYENNVELLKQEYGIEFTDDGKISGNNSYMHKDKMKKMMLSYNLGQS
jgi:hypothetical protein